MTTPGPIVTLDLTALVTMLADSAQAPVLVDWLEDQGLYPDDVQSVVIDPTEGTVTAVVYVIHRGSRVSGPDGQAVTETRTLPLRSTLAL